VGPRGLTPLVGREQEVGLLLERWHWVKAGQGQVVLLSGEPGIGKSRLVQVLKDHVTSEPHTRLECRSLPHYQNSALYPIIDLLHRLLPWQDNASPDEKLDTLAQTLGQYRLPVQETIPLLAPLLSLPLPEDRYPLLTFSPERQRQKTLEVLLAMLLEPAAHRPVLFILEDLHWTDPSTLELLALLMDQIPTVSFCALLTYRPTFQPPWSSRSYVTQVTLSRLAQPQVGRMAEHVAGGKRLPAEVLRQVVEKTDGVPLFVEEMTKAVLESGILQDVNGHYELTGSVSAFAIPATLHDSLMARLDRLGTAKAVAQYAAVLGRHFSYAVLHAVSQLDEPTLQRELGRLVDAELLYQRGLPPQATYLFKHALIRDIAYESLLRSTRQGYHQRIAHILEEQFPETVEAQPELLAYHYTEAGLAEKAVHYWHQAGHRAIQRSAHVEAINHLTQGLALLQMLPKAPERTQQEVDMHIALGTSLIATKGYAAPEVGQTYSQARHLCAHLNDPLQLFEVLLGLWQYYVVRDEHQTAHELAERLLPLAQQVQDAPILLAAHQTLGTTLFFIGAIAAAHTHYTQTITYYYAQQHHSYEFLHGEGDQCLGRDAWVLWYLGYPDQAWRRSHEAVTLAQQTAHPFSRCLILSIAATFHQFRREVRLTQEHAEAALSLAKEQGFPYWVAYSSLMRGWALAHQGQVEEGIEQITQGLRAYRATGAVIFQPYILARLAEAEGIMGQPEASLTALAEALTLVDTTGECWYQSELYRLKGAFLLQLSADNQREAEACFQHALTIAQDQGAKAWELRTATSLAHLWQQQGKRQEARDLLAPVYAWFTEGFDTPDLQEAKALLDELL
jgi:predicted ATPase